MIDSGSDLNATYIDSGRGIHKDANGEAFTGRDIAITAASTGRFDIVNELIRRGYNRDYVELFVTMKLRIVNEQMQPEKEKTRQALLAKFSELEQRKNIPALIDELRRIVGNEHELPYDFNSPLKDPERDPDIIALEKILKS